MRILQFDEIAIDVEKMQVRKGAEVIDVEPKSFRVLVYLAENASRVVSKDELLKAIWNGAFVTDNALTRVIAQLRKALGDDAKQARYIETVPTVGYRFLAQVQIKEALPTPPGTAAEPPVPEYQPRKINWWIPIGALSAIILAYLMPFIQAWTSGGPPVLKPVQFTTASGVDLHGSFSPDGSNLAYASDRGGSFEIFVKQVAPGGREIPITSDGKQNLQPAWSPDGANIVYASLGNGGIFVIPALGGMPRRLSTFGSQPAWSPDSRQIVFRSEGITSIAFPEILPATPSTLWIVVAEGGKPEQLTQATSALGRHSDPHFSSDGRHLGFLVSEVNGRMDRRVAIAEMDLRTRQVTTLNAGGPQVIDFVYGPDGSTIFFLGGTGNDRSGLFRLPRNGNLLQLMRFDFTQVRDLALTSGGNRVAYSATRMVSNLWQVKTSGETKQVSTESTFRVTAPMFSPDGTKLAYLQRKLGLLGDIWVSDADGTNAIQITKRPESSAFMASWLPDSKSLVYTTNPDGSSSLEQFSLSDGSEKIFLKLGAKTWVARLSPDGKEVAYHREDGTEPTVWKLDAATGRDTQLTFAAEPASYPCWSPDGKQIAVELRRGDTTHVGIVPSNGGPIRQVTNRPGHAWPFTWSPDGKQLAVAATWDGVWNIHTLNVETGATKKITDNKLYRVFLRYPAWSPKGDPIVFEQNETKGNIFLADMPK